MAGTGGPRPVLVAALKVLSEASEEAIMDSLAEFRVSHRARLAALFGQSVAEGLGAYRLQLEQATYDPAVLASALFGELPDDGPLRDDLPSWSEDPHAADARQDAAEEELSGAQVTQTTPDDYVDTIPSEVYGYPSDEPQAACAADTGGVFGGVAAVPAPSAEFGGKQAGQNKAPPPPLPVEAAAPSASGSGQTPPKANLATTAGTADPVSKKNTQKRPPAFPPATSTAASSTPSKPPGQPVRETQKEVQFPFEEQRYWAEDPSSSGPPQQKRKPSAFLPTCQAPRESRWLTWTRLSAKRGFPNLPVTRESLFAIGALLKAGGYRSSAQYVSVAKQKHREAGFTWGPDLDEARAQCLRSVNRGLGPATPKLDLRIENANDRFASLLQQAYLELKVSFDDRIQFAAQACIAACWFMLRGIELANVQARDVVFNRQAGCRDTTPPELFGTAFQKCSVASKFQVIMLARACAFILQQDSIKLAVEKALQGTQLLVHNPRDVESGTDSEGSEEPHDAARVEINGSTVKKSDDERLILEAATKNYWSEYVKEFESVTLLGTFTKAFRQVPEPQKLVTMLDAIEAIKWALMFARWCDEHDVRAFFDKAFLHVTLQMRASKSFSEASAEVRTKGDFGQKGDHKGRAEDTTHSAQSSASSVRFVRLVRPYDPGKDLSSRPTLTSASTQSATLDLANTPTLRDPSPAPRSWLYVNWAYTQFSFGLGLQLFYTRSVRNSPPGLQGQEGCKFRQWCQWLSTFRKALQRQHVFLVENVLPSAEVHRELDKLVGHNSFVVDAASWGVVSRPRLWWSNVLSPPALDCAQPPVVLAGLARWRRYNRCWQLVPSSNLFPRQNAAECPTAVFHPDVVAGRSVFPCLTTPAPSEKGRDPPQKRRRTESPETLRRWAAASRQYPPYQYRTRALVTIQGRITTPDAETRETASQLKGQVQDVRSGIQWDPREAEPLQLVGPTENPFEHWALKDLQDEQEAWLQSAPDHVRLVYKQGGDQFVLQPLVVLHLLRLFEFPGLQDLADELQFGFKVLGPLPPGTHWDVRQDAKYSRPLTKSQFTSVNDGEHKNALAQEQGGSEHTPAMLAEIDKEMLKTRFKGPFVPDTVAESPAAFGSRAFPVVQQDKVRRADDWRRSGHNSTVFVLDSQPYAGTQTVLTSVQAAADFGQPVLAALDHDGAYRALPVRDPDECFVFVPSEKGPEVYQHLVLPFGGTGSVWAYLRIADVICLITLVLAYIPASHFVDDFYFSEPDKTADSAFECFCLLQSLLGFTMKESKAQKPCSKSTLLGVLWEILQQTVAAGPSQGRLEKLQSLLEKILSDDSLTREEAAHLAGKLNFVCSWVFGGAGKALLKCIYTRQHSPFPQKKLNEPLSAALRNLLALLPSLKPREFPLQRGVNTSRPHVLYADAFVTLAGCFQSAAKWLKQTTPLQVLRGSVNGLGAVLFANSGQKWAYRATVPRHLLARAASTKAFIFWLEAIGQIVSIAAAARVLSGDVLCFVDNVASEHALKKGYSKDPLLTNLLGEWEISDSLGCSRLYPDFDNIWDLLFEMTKRPVDPKSDLFGEMVNLLA
ncbi:unnamed protein product, partial [Symbiodinium necroappetens]